LKTADILWILPIQPWHLIIEGVKNSRYPLDFTYTPWHLIIYGVENSRYPLDFTSTVSEKNI